MHVGVEYYILCIGEGPYKVTWKHVGVKCSFLCTGEGLITYMRTDGLSIGEDALAEIRSFIKTQVGEQYVSKPPRVYKWVTLWLLVHLTIHKPSWWKSIYWDFWTWQTLKDNLPGQFNPIDPTGGLLLQTISWLEFTRKQKLLLSLQGPVVWLSALHSQARQTVLSIVIMIIHCFVSIWILDDPVGARQKTPRKRMKQLGLLISVWRPTCCHPLCQSRTGSCMSWSGDVL